MMSWLEEKYAKLSCSHFRNYRIKSRELINFSCPFCGDSATNPHKARGFVYTNKNRNWKFLCHNCGKSESFYDFLKEINPSLHSEYVFEKFANSDNNQNKKEEVVEQTVEDFFDIKVDANIKDYAMRLDYLKDEHPVRKYLLDRKIPLHKFNEIYYSDDINNLKKVFSGYDDIKFPKEDRLVIPVQDAQKNLVGVVTRTINSNAKVRYLNMVQKDGELVYGIDKIDHSKPKYVVEGPLDSFFLDNALAVAGADLFRVIKRLDDNTTYIFDNQPRNREIVSRMERMANLDKKIVVWPSNLFEKDINDMVLAGNDVQDIINKHTYRNLEALLHIGKWRKI
jgi:predicted RNA-binding Zn-ribbon protein involved in translation (DUF1610 family)